VADPARHQQPNVSIAQMILPNGFEYRLRHIPHRHGNFETNRARRIPQSMEMFLEPEDTPDVKANAIEDSIAVKQTVIQDRDLRVRFRIKFSIDVNFRFLDARRWTWATFNRRLDDCLVCRFVDFRFV